MKKRIAIFISSLLVILSVFESVSLIAFANDKSNGYAETHYQFNMDYINFSVENKTHLVISTKNVINPVTKNKIKNEKEKIENFLDKYPDITEQLTEMVNNNSYICAFGYTEAEVEYDENEQSYVRVKDTTSIINSSINGLVAYAADKSKTGSSSKKEYFTLVTTITRRGTSNPYTYQTVSTGTWSKNSTTGGKKYPASGDDFILQACPSGLTRSSDSVSITYNHGRTAKNGVDYSRLAGDTNYIKYSVADDPLGINQMKKCQLIVTSKGNAQTYSRMINSYYVHTWKTLSISVSVSASASSDKKYGVSLSISPSIVNKSWQVYSYVTFAF